jgi:hypothetical protein
MRSYKNGHVKNLQEKKLCEEIYLLFITEFAKKRTICELLQIKISSFNH